MNIVTLHLNITNRYDYEESINRIIETHKHETEPFLIVGIYHGYYIDTVPVWVRLWGTLRVWQVARHSRWNRVIVLTGISPDNNRFVSWITRRLTHQWIAYIEPDEESALRKAEELSRLVTSR